MAQLLVRNLEPEVVKKLRQKAAADGISMEEEHRRILRLSLLGRKRPKPKMSFKEYLLTMPVRLTETEFPRRNDPPRPVDF